ncbi:hypothetical protein FB446DRAFT_304373 [Lentinula raphanica]|nr:hypothetical protein FB446DRAFT_304373 [Lentinula raphanica]
MVLQYQRGQISYTVYMGSKVFCGILIVHLHYLDHPISLGKPFPSNHLIRSFITIYLGSAASYPPLFSSSNGFEAPYLKSLRVRYPRSRQ